jgi:hypothetical protein
MGIGNLSKSRAKKIVIVEKTCQVYITTYKNTFLLDVQVFDIILSELEFDLASLVTSFQNDRINRINRGFSQIIKIIKF